MYIHPPVNHQLLRTHTKQHYRLQRSFKYVCNILEIRNFLTLNFIEDMDIVNNCEKNLIHTFSLLQATRLKVQCHLMFAFWHVRNVPDIGARLFSLPHCISHEKSHPNPRAEGAVGCCGRSASWALVGLIWISLPCSVAHISMPE